jgi:cathepsin L
VKDQGSCGSCWAFAAAATIESYIGINTGLLTEVSMQELVSCMPNEDSCGGTGGCQGATAELAYDYLAQYGLPELWTYGYLPNVYWNSYTGTNGDCLRDTVLTIGHQTQPVAPRFATGTGYNLLARNDYDELMNGIANIGPMAVNIDATNWHDYESGVFSGCAQTDVDINHVVQLVGYGTDAEYGDYWTIRNSWSVDYGEEGYIRLARSSGYCGMDYHNGMGVGCDYDPTNVTVCGMCGILYDSSYPLGAGLV